MTLRHAPLSLFALVVMLSACSARRIPGTEITDTADTRAILAVMESYRVAMENRDAEKLLTLVGRSFRDNAGTATPDDDLDYAALQEEQPKRLARISDVRLELTVRKVEVAPKENSARAVYTYNMSFRMPGLTNRPHNESEIKEMRFAREQGTWKIVSGI